MSYKIEKGIPIPNREIKYPLNEMEVGDSFLVDDMSVSTARSSISREAKKYPDRVFRSVVTRELTPEQDIDETKEVLRVWRIK